jgi:pimeloyl-ACP methyl ester carboxylesterase
MGAVIAELTAFTVPTLVKGLALLDGVSLRQGVCPRPPPHAHAHMGEANLSLLRSDHEAAYRSLEPYYADLTGLPEIERTFLRQRVIERVESETQLRAYFASMRSLVLTAATGGSPSWARFGLLPGPILLGWGEEDRVMSGIRRRLYGPCGKTQSSCFSWSGTSAHQETPAAVAEAIAAFWLSVRDRRLEEPVDLHLLPRVHHLHLAKIQPSTLVGSGRGGEGSG